ncbi:MAG: OsmC family protein [Chloroflexi bacterium]|nr:OsmC family protein [Chloroflexota bacterium]MBI3167881.1 OsmC family protein [Chloroflexota bacterium]
MTIQDHIRESMLGVIGYYTQNPEKALSQDKEAIAVIEEGLRVRATGPNGQTLICDMPKGLGGDAAAPSPGWAMRAALANCEAIMISLRAAQLGVELKTLEVRVDSVSDDRGMLGMDDSKPAGPMNMKVSIRIGADGVSEEKLHEIIAWAEKHSPVGDALTRAMPMESAIEIVG